MVSIQPGAGGHPSGTRDCETHHFQKNGCSFVQMSSCINCRLRMLLSMIHIGTVLLDNYPQMNQYR